MKKFLTYAVAVLISCTSLALTACGDDEPDIVKTVQTYTAAPRGTFTIRTPHGDLNVHIGTEYQTDRLYFSVTGSGQQSGIKMAYAGAYLNVAEIKTVPTTGWSTDDILVQEGGWAIQYVTQGVAYYVRMFVSINRGADGEIVGITAQCQPFTPVL